MKKSVLSLWLIVLTVTLQAQSVDLTTENFAAIATDESHLQYNFTLKNTGTSPQQGYGLKLIFSANNVLDFNDLFAIYIPFQDDPSQSIGANQSKAVSGTYVSSTPGQYMPSGSWFIFLEVNYSREVSETNYSNNITLGNQITINPYTVDFMAPPTIGDITDQSFVIKTTAEPDMTKIYYLVQIDGMPAPAEASLKNADEIYPWISETPITNLGPNIDYDVYLMGEYYNELVTNILKIDVKTIGNTVPQLNASVYNLIFSAIDRTTDSQPRTYTLKGFHLTADVDVEVQGKFLISENGTDYSGHLSFDASEFSSDGEKIIYVKFLPGGEAGKHDGEIIHSSENASNKILFLHGIAFNPANSNFDGLSDLNETGWTGVSVEGYQAWELIDRDNTTMGRSGSEDKILRMDGSINGNTLNEDWLVSPKIDLADYEYTPSISFDSYTSDVGPSLKLKYSTNYIGQGPLTDATWTDLEGDFPFANTSAWSTSSGIEIPKVNNVYIAFVYTSTDQEAARWLIDNFRIADGLIDIPAFTLNFQNVDNGTSSEASSISVQFAGYGPITVSVSAGFEVSLNNVQFASSVTLTEQEAAAGKQIYVRYTPSEDGESVAGSIVFLGEGLSISRNALSGSTSITTAIEEFSANRSVLYPNPTQGAVFVNSDIFPAKYNAVTVGVTNGMGAQVAKFKTSNVNVETMLTEIMNHVQPGIYLIILQSGKQTIREKIMKE